MWTIDKLARLRMGYGVDNGCINCNTNDKIITTKYIGWNTSNYAYCVTPNQTNNSIQINVQNYNRYSFDANGLWEATDWQAQSTQYFTNYGYKTVGAYSLYQKCGCSGGITTSLEFTIPVIQAAFVSDNGTSCTIQIQNPTDTYHQGYDGKGAIKKIWQEINGNWVQLSQASVSPYSRGGSVQNNANVNIGTSSTPIRFKADGTRVFPNIIFNISSGSSPFSFRAATYTIEGHTYTIAIPQTVTSIDNLAIQLNSDLASRTNLPDNVASAFFAVNTNTLINSLEILNPLYSGGYYNVVDNVPNVYTPLIVSPIISQQVILQQTSFSITITQYEIAGTTFVVTTPFTATDPQDLAIKLNTDFSTQIQPPNTIGTIFTYANNCIIVNTSFYTGVLSDYSISKTEGTYIGAGINVTSWTDMWLECLYTPIPPIPPTPPAQEFIDYGKAYCKIQNYKCIGRFADVEDLQEIADQKLVNILATNDTFFTSLL